MKIFFKAYLASLLAGMTFFFLLVLSLLFMPKEEKIAVRKNSILHLKLDRAIVEQATEDPFENFNFLSFDSESAIGLNEVTRALRAAKSDDNIKGVFLEFGFMSGGLSTLKEMRDAIIDFKTSGKFVWSYADYYTQGSYYIASVADSVFFNPSGYMEWQGLSSTQPFMKEMFENIGVKPVVVRGSNNRFKSAVEPLISNEMSPENREQMETLLGDLWSFLKAEVAESRDISADSLQAIADGMKGFIPSGALKHGLVDKLAFRAEIEERLKELTGAKSVRSIPMITVSRYEKSLNTKDSENRIAVIYAQGDIVMGDGDAGSIGPNTYVKAIQKAVADDDVKAIVLRVNSPGGSALSSDIIHNELVKAQKVKPLIVSMGDYAASGGYFIACPADTIIAQPNTVTGSIGVFMMFFTAQELLESKMGVHFSTVKTAEMADLGNLSRDLTPQEYNMLQKGVDETYGQFISRVTSGRGLDSLFVDSIGQGRVWSGTRAKELGLVDELGGLNLAIEIAAKKAGISDYELYELPRHESSIEKLMKSFGQVKAKENFLRQEMGEYYDTYIMMQKLRSRQGMMARMPVDFIIK